MFMPGRREIAGLLLGAGMVGTALIGACAEQKGALMLAINTDMKAPKDVNAVSITVSTNGAIKHSFIGRVTPQGEVLLPATLAIVEPADKNASVRIRVMAFQDRKPRVLRDVRTTVPTGGRTALLRVALNFASDASAVGSPLPDGVLPDPVPGTGATTSSGGTSGGGTSGMTSAGEFDFFGAFQPPCPDIEKQTIIDGECKDNFVDPGTLPDFEPGALGDSTAKGSCFDVATCFGGAVGDGTVGLDRATCILQLKGADPARLNLALVTPDTGECVRPGECYVPLDRGAGGWTEQQGGVQLPPFVCRLLDGKSLRLATSTSACAAKAEANPICRAAAGADPGGPAGSCAEFQVGATVDPAIGGSARSQVIVQSTADYANAANVAAADLTASCTAIAKDLGATQAEQDAANANADPVLKMNAWCDLARSVIGATKATAAGALSVQFMPPLCRTSVSEKAACQARCDGGAKCDLFANPPTCTGGSLFIECSGSCVARAGATVKCVGTCTGQCSGSCVAPGGVECAGVCTGVCKASAGGTGLQPDGSCKGSCAGTCASTASAALCTGTCDGACTASCNGSATSAVKCDGNCSAAYQPLYCEGGKLEGGCKVEATCDGSCDVSVAAKAECPPPAIFVVITGAANAAAAAKLKATLEANLGAILALKARLEGMARLSATLAANANAVTDIKAACIPVVVAAAAAGLQAVTGEVGAATVITRAVGL